MAVRSIRLGATANTTSPGGDVSLFTVPAGFVVIVKYVAVHQATATSTNWRLGVSLAGGLGTVYIHRQTGLAAISVFTFMPWQVMHENDSFVYRDSVGGNGIMVSGALLPK